jgi:hypothetical protein
MNRVILHGKIPYSFEFVDTEDDFLSYFADDDWLPSPVENPPLLKTSFSCTFSCNDDVS